MKKSTKKCSTGNVPKKGWPVMFTLLHLQNEQGAWSDVVMKGQPIKAKIRHLMREVREMLKDPKDLVEHADVLLLLLDINRLCGFTADQLMLAASAKLAVNKARKWNPPDKDGCITHVKGT
jgi:predicted house-cleaning noncanonical NTP pyrophosphatase (MazG superfamily)